MKDAETERLVRQLAERKRTGITGAIRLAVSNELVRDGAAPLTDDEVEHRTALIRAVQEQVRREGIDWSLSEDEILGYDENGIPEQPYLDDRRR